jgi:hypothetical protein
MSTFIIGAIGVCEDCVRDAALGRAVKKLFHEMESDDAREPKKD